MKSIVRDTLELLTRLSGQPVTEAQLLEELCEMLLPALEALYAREFYPESLQATLHVFEKFGSSRTYVNKKGDGKTAASLTKSPHLRKGSLEPFQDRLAEVEGLHKETDAEASVEAARRVLEAIHTDCSSVGGSHTNCNGGTPPPLQTAARYRSG